MSVFDKTKYPPLNLEHLLEELDDRFESMSSRDGLDGFVGGRTGRRWFSRPELPPNVCRYFNQGFCKHGNRCRFLHEDPCGMLSPSGNEVMEHNASPQSLVELELEIVELLKSQRGKPVSIASLPMLYYDKYKKTLQAEGYLTESQRHEKVGYNLSKLLARLKNSVRLIDRPNGQHSVILAEDVPKHMEYVCDKEDCGTAGLRQIYLTFPPHSTFTEKDVFDYFENFGPVQEVRIPWQEKRMFGFVTFVHPETVQQILSKDTPHHYVCGARILAKRYREKPRALYRKQSYKFQQQMDCQKIRILQACKMMRMIQIMEAQKLAIELEQISKVEAVCKHSSQSAYFGMGRIHSTQTHLEESMSSLLDGKDPPTLEDDNIPDNVGSVRSLNLPENLF